MPKQKGHSSQPEVVVKPLTAKDVTLQPLIMYCNESGRHVKSSSLHQTWFTGAIKVWDSFEDEVTHTFSKVLWHQYPDTIAYDLPKAGISEFHIGASEHFLCGEEISVSGRWVQHALHPMSAVSKVLEFGMVFGDWKATAKRDDFFQAAGTDSNTGKSVNLGQSENPTNKGKGRAVDISDNLDVDEDPITSRKKNNLIPDYALMVASDGAPRAVGEAKTHWKQNFLTGWDNFVDNKDGVFMRHLLGQVGNYMIELELKYGFLTSYNYTFFLKRENEWGRETIYCSRPIPYNATSSSEHKISVRQGLLFLQHCVQGDGWYAEKISETGIVKKKKGESAKEVRERMNIVVAKNKKGSQSAASFAEDDEEQLARKLAGMDIQGPTTRSRARFAEPLETEGNKPRSSGGKSRK
ncbi:hypothetical protein MaudCBS49596_008062 [Microsporum audouinii]